MDPSYVHQSTRYVTVSPRNPNFYGSHVYHHNYLPQPPPPQAPSSTQQLPPPPPLEQQPLRPPPPRPQQQQLRLPAPPPPPPTKNLYNSYNSQFTFNPNLNPNPNPKIQNFGNTHHIHQRNLDFSHRISLDGDRHHHQQQQQQQNHCQRLLPELDARRDMWETPRIVPDLRSVVNNLEHHRQFDTRPMSPYRSIDKIKHELDTNYRFRGLEYEHKNGSSNQRVEFVTRRTHFASDTEEMNSSNYNIISGSHFDSNELLRSNVRAGALNMQSLRDNNELLRIDVRDGAPDRQSFREREIRDSVIAMLPNGENVGGGIRAFSGKCEFYGLDSERYGNSRGSKENSFEYNRTPRKQVQKKSALLRIQKPCFRNRDNDELHYSGYFDGMKSGSFRGKGKILYSELGMGAEEEREGSPVELDVSFKSNSLVAKAIVTSSSSAVVSDTNLMPKNRKIRKVIMSDKDCASSQMNELSDNSIKLDSSRDVVNNASTSDTKDAGHSGRKVAPSALGVLPNHNSQSYTSEANDSIAKTTAERSKGIVSDKVGTDAATSKTSLPKVAKKKKIVKKVLRKVANPTSLQSTGKLDELVQADCSTLGAPVAPMQKKGVKPSKEKITPARIASDPILLQPYQNEVTMLCEKEELGGSSQAAMRSEEVSTDVDSGGSCVAKIKRKIKRKMSGSISPLTSSSHKEIKINEGSVNANNSLHSLHNTNKDRMKPLSETTVSDIGTVEGVSKQLCHKRNTLLLENGGTKESSENLFSVGGNNSHLFCSEKNKEHRHFFAHEMNTTTNLTSLAISKEKISNFDNGIVDASGKQPCKSQVDPACNSGIVEGFPLVISGRSSDISALSSSVETRVHNVSIDADFSNHDGCSISDSDNICINSEEINLGTGDNIGGKSTPDGVTISLDNGGREGLQNTIQWGDSEKDMPNSPDKSKVSTSLSEAMITDMLVGPVKAISSTQCMNTTTSESVKDSSPAEVSCTGNADVEFQPCPNGVSILHLSNSTEECSEPKILASSGFIGTSPENRKRRKFSACHTGITSQMTSEISEGPNTSDLPTSGVGLPSNLNEALTQPEGEVKVSKIENSLAQVSSGVAVRVRDDCLKREHPRAHSCSVFEESDILNAHSSCPTGFGSEQMVNATLVMDGNNHIDEIMSMENSEAEKRRSVAVEEQLMMCNETAQFKIPSEHQSPDVNQRLPDTDVESDGCHLEKNDLPSSVLDTGISTTNSNDEIMEFDALSDMGSPEILSAVPVLRSLNCQASTSQTSNEKATSDEKMPNGKYVIEGISNLFSHATSSQYVKNNLKLDYAVESAHLIAGRTVPLPPLNVKVSAPNLNPKSGETYGKKNQLNLAASRNHSSHSSFVFTAKRNTPSSTRITKPRTWHRTENSSASSMTGNKSLLHAVPLQSQLPEKVSKFQSMSYIRKGNSLVRKPAPVAALPQVSHGLMSSVYQLNSSEVGELKKTTGSDNRADVIDPPNLLRAGGVNTPFERPRTPPLPTVVKVPKHATNLSGDCTSSLLSEPISNGCSETTSDPQKIMESNDVLTTSNDALRISETAVNQTGSVNSLEGHVETNNGPSVTSNVKRITYVRRKSNQLVAASNQSFQSTDKTHGVASDGYYKRRKNQLIRTSQGSQVKQTVTLPDGTSISEGKTAPKDIFSRSYNSLFVTKIRQPSRLSLVWTLKTMQSSKDDDFYLYRQKVLPSLFPWKRTAYWRRFAQNSVSMSDNSYLSAIGRKLLLMRKRDAVYTRSSHGFSLWKSKVLSVGGSSLKWSKSIEKRSKKANEEATLAVAAVGRKSIEQNSAASFSSETKNRTHSSRERIFRIGSVRYKMDASRRTLQRISDDESSCTAALNLEKNAKKSYIPRRLVIGTDEYVRIGNGNQLIRDPKKRTRVLASEKVRWSLHTARLRLARKRKYCQFFTRFGKCNKDDGKCPYIHDPSKIAVCTKFLNGLCSSSNCKLTHKVIPERMPDCSYFLQGLCSNKDCPYRHVHVNPKASTCEGFLKGYCADGNECRKKHSYVCPIFEATGSCPLGSKCKLHHPKSRSKGKKIRRSREQKNTRGRYFGSMSVEDSEPRIMMSQGHSMLDSGDICFDGKFADYISLASIDEEAGEISDMISEPTSFDDSDAADLQFDDLDELIKPIRIMNIV